MNKRKGILKYFLRAIVFFVMFSTISTKVHAENIVYKYGYTGTYQEFEAPQDGTYKVQLWGAQGGRGRNNNALSATGGYGAYTSGLIELKKGQKLYVYVGGAGINGTKSTIVAGGWNGGGRGDYDHSDDESAGSGGGATDIRLVPTSETKKWNEFDSLKSRIMVAAGGGGGQATENGLPAGGLTSAATTNAPGSTQTSGSAFGVGSDGVYRASNKPEAGGGGGYYGGNSLSSTANWSGNGSGGTSFISGFNGCDAITEDSTSTKITHTGQSVHYSGVVFQYGLMIRGNGVAETDLGLQYKLMPSPTGSTYDLGIGNSGNGYAIIEYLETLTADDYPNYKYDENAFFTFSYTGSYKTFVVPYSGIYKLEAWGGRGGAGMRNSSLTYRGGYGGYAAGEIHLNAGDKLYVYVGQAGYNGRANCTYCGGYGGWNGGAQGGNDSNHDSSPDEGGGGGGATDFRLVPTSASTTWNEFDSLKSRILIAGGGSGGTYGNYGQAGGLYLNRVNTYALGQGQKGYSATSGSGGGGGGYFGGLSNQCDGCIGYGGTSYVSGSDDDLALDESSTSTDIIMKTDSIHYTGLTFDNPVKINGNSVMPNWYNTGTMTGNNNNGYAKITIVEIDNSEPLLSNITVTNGTFNQEVKPEIYEYDVSVDSEQVKVDVDATTLYEEHTIFKGIGEITLKAGVNVHYIGVTSQTGEIGIYKLNINRPASSYKYLENITVDGVSIPNFQPEILEYYVPLDAEQEEVDIQVMLGRPSQKVSGDGKVTVGFGTTTHNIDVISEDSSQVVTYKIHFMKDNSSKLKSLNLEGYPLEPEFDPETLNYKIAVPNGVLSLDVDAIPYDSSAKVSVKGNGYLKSDTTNVITITVTQATAGTTVYTVTVEREGVVPQQSFNYSCTQSQQEFEAPGTGFYKIELWGAQGGYGHRNYSYVYRGGYGGYTSGTIWLSKGDKLYVYVGCQGGNAANTGRYNGGTGGYNGGAQGGNDKNHDSQPDAGGGGGGATDVRLVSGTYNDFTSLKSRIMVAGGGAGGTYSRVGGAGNVGKNNDNGYALLTGQIGYAATSGSGGGGGGYYGGISVQCDGCLGYGGTSYVSGGEGYLSISETSTSNNVQLTESNIHYSGKYFTDIEVINGTESMPSKTSGYTIGNSGHGAAKITLLPYPSENNYLSSLSVKVDGQDRVYTPTLNIEDLDYYLTLDPDETKITLSARPEDSTATISGLGEHSVLALENIYPIVVTAENGDIRTYNVHVTRAADDNPYPNDIIINGLVPSLCSVDESYCALNPTKFDKDTNTYYLTVPSRIKQLWFNVDKSHDYQTVNGEGKISLDGGENNITITITSEDGLHSSVYNYIVTRDMTGNTDLSNLELVHPPREINYDPDVTEYYVSLPNSYTSIEEVPVCEETDPSCVEYDESTDSDDNIARLKIITDDPNATYVLSGNKDFETGMNQTLITVTAANGETKVYILNIYRERNSNIFLSSLEVKDDTTTYLMTPIFNRLNVGPYSVTVPNNVDNVDIIATPEVSTTMISGTGNKELKTGNNSYSIITTSESGEIETYTITIFREKNSNAYLSDITISGDGNIYSLETEFNRDTLSYNVNVEEGINTIDIVATPEISTTTYKLLDDNKIKVGNNIKRVMAIAEDGTSLIYTLTINRQASTNNYLQAINLSTGTLDPNFDKEIESYNVEVENNITSITITGIKDDALATLKGNGKYSLAVGNNEIMLTVTSESGEARTYLINVIRKPNSNAYLKMITTNVGILVPEFNRDVNEFSINVENDVDTITIVGTPEVGTTKVEGNNTYTLVSGDNWITLTTLAEDGITTLTYKINVIKDKSDNDNISNLVMEEGAISPKFDSNILYYNVNVPYDITKGTFHVTLEDNNATYVISGADNFDIGENIVVVTVISESGLQKDYTINVNRQEKEISSNYLSSLTLSSGTLIPDFDKEHLYYEVELPYSVSSVNVSATLEDTLATLTGTGNYKLNVGSNLIVVKVQGTDGKTRDYQIVVKRKANDEARLSSLSISNTTLDPGFDKDVYDYKLSTTSASLNFNKIVPVDSNAKYEISGNNFSELGEYIVVIKVTAADGVSYKEYKLHVTKEPSNNNNLSSLAVLDNSIKPSFNKAITLYTVTVGNDVNSIAIEATAEDPKATISGLGSHTLNVGENQLVVEVTSESGIKKSYVVIVTKEGSNNNDIVSLVVNNGVITPEFTSSNLTYDVEVPYEETALDLSIKLADENASYIIKGNNLVEGNNIVSVIVTAENGDIKTYTLNVIRKEIVSALLKNISVKNYELTPSFNSNITNYSMLVDNEITSLDLKVETLDKNATYIVSGNENLVVGDNQIIIDVTASDGVTKERYILNVTKQAYSNSFLDYFYTSEGDVSPTFDRTIMSYTIDVAQNVESIEFFGEAIDKSATITGLGVHDLKSGANKIPVVVSTTSGIKRTYYITVNRLKDDNNDLTSLIVKKGSTIYTLEPTFDPSVTTYNVTVPKGTPSVTIEANTTSLAQITGIGTKTLNPGSNLFDIQVTSESGLIKIYTINIEREISSNNFLTNLEPSVGELEPEFNYTKTDYTLNLDSASALLAFNYSTEDASATVTGTESLVIPDGTSTRQIVVTAEDGTTRTYNITVNKERTDNAKLSSLSINGYSFEESFSPDNYEYHVTVPNSKTTLLQSEVIAIAQDKNATISKNANISLSTVNDNEFIVTVTAPDGFTKVSYKIIVTREKGTAHTLTSIKVNEGYLTSAFNQGILEYEWKIPKSITKVTSDMVVVSVTDPNSEVIKTEVVDMTSDDKVFTIRVTSEDGSGYTEYKLNLSYDLSTDATLKNLTINKGYYEPNFAPETYEYDVFEYEDASDLEVTAIPTSETSVVTSGNGVVNLDSDEVTHYIVVTAEDGSTQNYILYIHRTIKTDKNLKNIGLNGLDDLECIDDKCELNPTFTPETISYEIKVPYEYKNLDLLVETMNVQQTYKLKVNDKYVNEYELPVGTTEVLIEVYDGMSVKTKEYTLFIERCKSNNTYLKSLVIDGYEIEPIFDKTIMEYTVNVAEDVDSVVINATPDDENASTYINGYNYLQEGNNDATITVYAPDGSTRTYIIHIIKAPLYNSYIKNITVSTGIFWDLTPKFNPTTFEYKTIVSSIYNKATIEAIPVSTDTVIMGTGEYDLVTGSNIITLVATEPNSGSVSIYKINVIKEASTNVDLKSLIVEEGDLTPTFEKGTTKYNVVVDSDVEKLTIHATLDDKTSTYIITGNEHLHSGNNIVNIIVMSEDKSVSKTYQLTVYKNPSSNNNLSSIVVKDEVNSYDLVPNFDKDVLNYDVTVPYTVEKVILDATSESLTASISGIGEEYLDYGSNLKDITVTSEDGNIKVYHINIYREYNLYLKNIVSDIGTLTPEFDKETLEYEIELPNKEKQITFVAQRESDKVTVDGSGTYSLVTGENVISFTVTAPDNHQLIYRVVVNREKDDNNYIKELNVEGLITPVFDKETLEYNVDVRNTVSSLSFNKLELESNTASYEIIGNSNFVGEDIMNKVIIRVTAENGAVRDYILNVYQRPDSFFSNRLLSMSISEGKLAPDFNPDINNYATTVSNSISELIIEVTKEDEYATVTGAGRITLGVGRNVIPITVTSKDGVSNVYTLVVYRTESNDATLKSLSVTGFNYQPIFNKLIENYNLDIGSETSNLDIIAEPTDSNAKVEITGNKNLLSGMNIITIKVTAPDNITTKTYTLTVTKSASKNNYLSDLSVVGYRLDKTYNKLDQGPYVVNVESNVNSINVVATKEVETSTVTGDGVKKLQTGRNIISIDVTSESGDVRTYTLIVNKAASTDSTLKDIILSDGNLVPEFKANILNYEVLVPEELDCITITGLVNDASATISGNGEYDIVEKEMTIPLVVTAQDGSSTTYNVKVVRDIKSSSKLSGLVVKDGELYPSFHKLITNYTILVPYEVKSLNMDITLEDSEATYVVTGNENFKIGSNQVTIEVTSKDNTSKTNYVLSVIRQSAASNYLKTLEVEGYTLTPHFSQDTLYYEVSVPLDVETVKIKATASDSTSVISGTGIKSVNPGENRFYVTVESASGVVRTYQIVVNREESKENLLLSLTSDVGTISPEFNPSINEYTITVPEKTTEVTLDGTVSINSTVIGLGLTDVKLGMQQKIITVTSQSGLINNYVVNIVRPASSNTELESLIPSNGELTYTNDLQDYEMEVDDNVNVISFVAIPKDKEATVAGVELQSLDYGENVIQIVVTAEDKVTTRTINIKITRMKDLKNIIVSPDEVLIEKNEEINISYTLEPLDTSYQEVEWISLDEDVALVDQNGKITGLGLGSTTIQVRSKHDNSIVGIVRVNVINKRITSTTYTINRVEVDSAYVIGLEPKTALKDFIIGFDNNPSTLHVYDSTGNEITKEQDIIGTSMTIKLIINDQVYDELLIAVRGDLTGDGIINVTDYNKLNSKLLKKIELTYIESKAADSSNDNIINVTDYNKLNSYLLKKLSTLN